MYYYSLVTGNNVSCVSNLFKRKAIMKSALRYFALFVVSAGCTAAVIGHNAVKTASTRQVAAAMPMAPCPPEWCGPSEKAR
jgi:hypothetical protein